MTQKIIELVEWLDRWFFRKVNVLTSFSSTLTDTKVPSEKLVKNSLDNKVDKVQGKGLSTNDYDNIAKTKVDNLKNVATTGSYNDLIDKPTISEQIEIDIDNTLDANSNNPVTNSAIVAELNNKANVNHTHSQYLTEHQSLANYVQTNDSRLSDARTPTAHTHTKNQISDFPNLATVATTGSYDDLTNKPEISGSGQIVNIGFGFNQETKEIYLEFDSE